MDLTGQRFGKLTAVSRILGERRTLWLCRCDCGKETHVRMESLVYWSRHSSRSCGCGRGFDLIGRTFGCLTVIGPHPKQKGSKKIKGWQCQCSCGKTKIFQANHLVSGGSASCGCRTYYLKPDSGLREVFSQYRTHARKRGNAWGLTQAEFGVLIASPCHYCGVPPSNRFSQGKSGRAFIYSGVDRSDNTLGYIPSNSVPCCGQCNHAKKNFPLKQFTDWLARVSAFQASLAAKAAREDVGL